MSRVAVLKNQRPRTKCRDVHITNWFERRAVVRRFKTYRTASLYKPPFSLTLSFPLTMPRSVDDPRPRDRRRVRS